MAEAETIDLAVEQGTDYTRDFLLQDSNGDPIDLVTDNAVARMKVKSDYTTGAITYLDMASDDVTPYLTFHRSGVTGRLSIELPHTVTEDTDTFFIDGETLDLVYDLEMESDTYGVKRVAKGDFILHKELTNE